MMKIKNREAVFGIGMVIMLFLVFLTFRESTTGRSVDVLPVHEVVIETENGQRHAFRMEIADTPEALQRGLMFREKLEDDEGMIFLFKGEPQPVAFWMKNTLIPLDMLFVARDGKVVSLHRQAQPHVLEPISSKYPVTAVVEINGGLSEKLGIDLGARVLYPFFEAQ